jgi:hypothetical protein
MTTLAEGSLYAALLDHGWLSQFVATEDRLLGQQLLAEDFV